VQEMNTATIIVVDDDASIRRALQMQLQTLGFKVQTFSSGEETLAHEFPAINACLLLDVYMPGMNGIELGRRLAASARQLPIILMTGHDDRQTRELIQAAHPAARLSKPFDEKALLRAIGKALRRSPVPRASSFKRRR
jgi:FixJ family two-component response regulator